MSSEFKKQDQAAQAFSDALALGFRVLRWALIIVLTGYLIHSCLFIIPQHEAAFVLRFGKIIGLGARRLLGPGLHMAFPYPVDEVVRVPVQRMRTITSRTFWYDTSEPALNTHAELNTVPSTLCSDRSGYTLTGDASILHSIWALRYTISDPDQFMFGVENMDQVMLNELDRAVLLACARYRADEILRADREFRALVDRLLHKRCREKKLGICIEGVDLLELCPPRQVRKSFDAVLQAEQERSEIITAARIYYTCAVDGAEAGAARKLSEAEAFKKRLISEVKADSEYFEKIFPNYIRNPTTISQILLQDTLRRVLKHVDTKYIVRENAKGKNELRIRLGPVKNPQRR